MVKDDKTPDQRLHDALMKGFMMLQTDLVVLARLGPPPEDEDG